MLKKEYSLDIAPIEKMKVCSAPQNKFIEGLCKQIDISWIYY